MAEFESVLTEVTLSTGGMGGILTCPTRLQVQPGQYLLGYAPELNEPRTTALFPVAIQPGALRLAAPLPQTWAAGMPLLVRGPLGRGFTLPAQARRVALAALNGNAERLTPLMTAALAQGAAVVLFSGSPPASVSDEVEILPLEQLPEAPAWADYLALELTPAQAGNWRKLLAIRPTQPCPCSGEALIITDMPCGGLAECGVCAVETRLGWRLACKDGPVFPLSELEAR